MPFIEELLTFKNNYFVETGTFEGETLDVVSQSNLFQQIYSIELSYFYYEKCKNKFKNKENIEIVFGNSKYDLSNVINNIKEPITFWLDSHWSDHSNIANDEETICPIMEELEQIKNHPIKNHTIIVDDIRLMNDSDFPVNLVEIVNKILRINPNYTIKFFDDFAARNDVLVAFIEPKICKHVYLTKCKSNNQSPGFADFLRGTCALFKFSKLYDFTLELDNTHPIFNFFQSHKNLVKSYDKHICEMISPLDYQFIHDNFYDIFENKKSFTVITNSFYSTNSDGTVYNYGEISNECKQFLKEILTPNELFQKRINSIFEYFNFSENDDYCIIHVRMGDNYLYHNSDLDANVFNLLNNKINFILDNDLKKVVLITDTRNLGISLRDYPRVNKSNFIYWDNCKTHLGDLNNASAEAISDTLVDFFIMSKANKIFYLNESGFSKICSLIYDIEYTTL